MDRIQSEEVNRRIAPKSIFWAFAGLFLLNLLLRIFYLRYQFVNGDEAVRALTATRVLDGARLYVDIVTDKPPGTTFFYAAVIALFGRSMTAVHLAAAVWHFATSVLIYLTAARFYGRRTGFWAALLFIYFSTTYMTQDVMAANTELLMALPYTASFYFFIRASGPADERPHSGLFLLIAGLTTGLAALFKQVGLFNLVLFALYEAIVAYNSRAGFRAACHAIKRLLFIGVGFAAVIISMILWLAANDATDDFWRYVIVLGGFYVEALPRDLWMKFLIGRALGYILFNAALWWLAVSSLSIKTSKDFIDNSLVNPENNLNPLCIRFEHVLGLWLVTAIAGVFSGGRFFGHYFIQVLPPLSLLAARGIRLLIRRFGDPASRPRAKIATAILCFLVLFSFVRFHSRTAVLAYETLTGCLTGWSQNWGMSEREQEAAEIARFVRDQIGEDAPLYIWGYALDVYWRSNSTPAARFLTPYYVTGRFPEIPSDPDPPGESFWRELRALFLEDLKRTRPPLILDVEGAIPMLPYPDIVQFIKENYTREGQVGLTLSRPFYVYRLKESREQKRDGT